MAAVLVVLVAVPASVARPSAAVEALPGPGATPPTTAARTGPSRDGAGPPATRLRYRAPVVGTVVDPFRPPPHPYGPGNRGIEIVTALGEPVQAAADGEVTFAGPVAGDLHVTIRHADGLRTTYSYLATVAVAAGEAVRRGAPIGTSGGRLHVGVRRPDGTYLDPATLLRGRRRARLVPGGDDGTSAPPVVGTAGPGVRGGAAGPVIAPSAGEAIDSPAGLAHARSFHDTSPPGATHGHGPPRRGVWAPGLDEPWEGDCNGTCRHDAAASRGRRPLRPPDPALEPEDEAIHPR